MAFPVRSVIMPSALVGKKNGRLLPSDLQTVKGLAGGADIRLVRPAARSFAAMQAAALKDGHTLKVATADRSYRPYASQEQIFRARYTPHRLPRPGARYWERQWWVKKPGVAAAAVPGTSNHGWGLAVDCGEENDGDKGTESFTTPTLSWLKVHAHSFGFSWEIQSEPWHLRYWAGDVLPKAVVLHEVGILTNTPTDPEGEESMQLINDPKNKRMFAGWLKDGTQLIDEYSTYIAGAGTDMPNISFVIDDQVAKKNIKKVG